MNVTDTHDLTFIGKEVDFKTYRIRFVTINCSSREEYERKKEEAELKYRKDIQKLKKLTDMKYTFSEWMLYWLEKIAAPRYNTSRIVVLNSAVVNFIMPSITEDISLSAITAEYVNNIIRKTETYSKSSGRSSRSAIKIALADAYDLRYIRTDISQNLIYIKDPKPSVPTPSFSNVKKLLEVTNGGPNYLEVLLMAVIGLRQGEVRGLKYEDFDRAEKTVFIKRQISHTVETDYSGCENAPLKFRSEKVVKLPKTEASLRKLRIPDFIFDLVDERDKQNRENAIRYGFEYQGWISVSFKGNIKNNTTLGKYIKDTCTNCGIPHITPHSLRHFAGTMLMERNVPVSECAKFLGHSEKVFFEIYAYLTDEADLAAKRLVSRLDPLDIDGPMAGQKI